jgi:hypothetical protein
MTVGNSKSNPDYWNASKNPYFKTGDDKILHVNYLSRARIRKACKACNLDRSGLRNAVYSRLAWLREYVMKTWDCTEIERGKNAKNSPISSFAILDIKSEPMMNVTATKHSNAWSAGVVTFDSFFYGEKTVRLQASDNPQAFWRSMYWDYLLPFIDDIKSVKIRLEGYAEPNTAVVCLASYAAELGLKTTIGPDQFYLLDYHVLAKFDSEGFGFTDSQAFPGRYSFGQMCHILNLIAGKPDICLDKTGKPL